MKASSFRNAALTVAGMFGKFGDLGKPEKEYSAIVRGSHRFEPGVKGSTRIKRNKTKKYRPAEPLTDRQLADGRYRYQRLRSLWYPTNTDSQIPGSRRGLR